MRQFIVIIAVMALVIGGFTQDNFLWSFRLFQEEPVIHQINQGEYLSQLSQKYYGTTDYWKELALINRAPKPDLVYPNEKILIPDIEKMRTLKRAKTISDVNKLVAEMEKTLSGKIVFKEEILQERLSQTNKQSIEDTKAASVEDKKAVVVEKTAAIKSSTNSGILYFFYMLGIITAIGSLVYFFLRRSKGEKNEKPLHNKREKNLQEENKPIKTDGITDGIMAN